jgi:hypothetical protein
MVESAKMLKKFIWASRARNGRFGMCFFEESDLGPLRVKPLKDRDYALHSKTDTPIEN